MTCFHTVPMPAASSRPLVLANAERSCCKGFTEPRMDLICSVTTARQQDSKTVVKHGGPVVLSGVTQEQDGLLAGRQHIAPQPLSVPADSPLYPEVFTFTQNKEPELAGIMSNITI